MAQEMILSEKEKEVVKKIRELDWGELEVIIQEGEIISMKAVETFKLL